MTQPTDDTVELPPPTEPGPSSTSDRRGPPDRRQSSEATWRDRLTATTNAWRQQVAALPWAIILPVGTAAVAVVVALVWTLKAGDATTTGDAVPTIGAGLLALALMGLVGLLAMAVVVIRWARAQRDQRLRLQQAIDTLEHELLNRP